MHYKFVLPPLPYDYSALEPYIDTRTMRIHHDKHFGKYVDNLNSAIKNYPQLWKWTLEELITNSFRLPVCIRQEVHNNAGGVYNHNFFFSRLQNNGGAKLNGDSPLMKAINRCFGSFDAFKDVFKKASLDVFGSGYCWLVRPNNSRIVKIMTTANQDTPLTHPVTPLICIDVWEHAYYLKHQNDRAGYIDDFLNLVNWQIAGFDFESENQRIRRR